MKIVLMNKELKPAIEFLQSMSLKAADSRHRSKLVKLLVAAFEELSSDERELMEKLDLLDENGELKKEEERDIQKVKEFNLEQNVLFDEKVTISGGLYVKNIDEIPRILNEYDGELSGQAAEVYDRLLDEFEKNTEEKSAE